MLDGASVAASVEEQPAAMTARVTVMATSLDILTLVTVETASEHEVTN